MEKVQGLGGEERGNDIRDAKGFNSAGVETLRGVPWHYPAKIGNPYLLMGDEKFKPVIREAYKAFEPTLERYRVERLARIAAQEKPKQ